MIQTSERTRKYLGVAQCMRLWPGWGPELKEMIDTGMYEAREVGNLISLNLSRQSQDVTWNSWAKLEDKGGGVPVDLGEHDADLVHYLLGMPQSVVATGRKGIVEGSTGYDNIVTHYDLGPDGPNVITDANWHMPKGYFDMRYFAVFEGATVEYSSHHTPPMRITFNGEAPIAVEVGDMTGWEAVLRHHIENIEKQRPSEVVTAKQAAGSLAIVLAAIKSADTGLVQRLG
ncbi:MAG: Gfo/Idh/MocA family oxidoreductase [archaeon]